MQDHFSSIIKKKKHSIVLLAVVDADYNFVVVDVGAYGRQSDASIFSNSSFGKMLKEEQLPLPESKPLPGTPNQPCPQYLSATKRFPSGKT